MNINIPDTKAFQKLEMTIENLVTTALLSIITLIFGLLSLVVNVYVLVCILWKPKRKYSMHKNTMLFTDIIYWMILSDSCFCLWIIFNWGPLVLIIDLNQYNILCDIIGGWGIFWFINGICWHFLLSFCALYLLCHYPLQTNIFTTQKCRYISILIIYLISGIFTSAPIILNKYYFNGLRPVNNQECSLRDSMDTMLIIHVPVIIILIFHYIVLVMLRLQWKKTLLLNSYSQIFKVLFERLLSFTIVYTITRLPSSIIEIYFILFENNIGLIFTQHITLSCIGLCNCIAWSINVKTIHTEITRLDLMIAMRISTEEYSTETVSSIDKQISNPTILNAHNPSINNGVSSVKHKDNSK